MVRTIVLFRAALAIIFGFVGQAAQSQNQDWQYEPYLNNGVFFETIAVSHHRASFGCAGYYPHGDPIQLEGGGITQPYTLQLELSGEDIVAMGRTNQGTDWYIRRDIVIASGGKGFLLPELKWNEMIGSWQATLSFSDPLILEILNNGGFAIQDRQAVLAQFSPTGLAHGLAQVLGACDAHWARLEKPVPPDGAALVASLRSQGFATPTLIPTPPPAQTQQPVISASRNMVMDALMAATRQKCQGQPAFIPDSILHNDFDGDGVLDMVFSWSEVSCLSGPQMGLVGGGYCGASQCSIGIFLSSRIAKRQPAIEFLGQGFRLDRTRPSDILVGVGLSDCHYQGLEPDCLMRWRWDGATFYEVPR